MSQHESSTQLAKAFLDVMPRTMWAVRAEIRGAARKRSRGALSVPQIRVLAQLSRKSLTNGELAERLGVSRPSMSRLVDGLARKAFVTRDVQSQDRRRVALKLSVAGRRYFHTVMKSVENRFSEQFSKLSVDQIAALQAGLNILGEVIQ